MPRWRRSCQLAYGSPYWRRRFCQLAQSLTIDGSGFGSSGEPEYWIRQLILPNLPIWPFRISANIYACHGHLHASLQNRRQQRPSAIDASKAKSSTARPFLTAVLAPASPDRHSTSPTRVQMAKRGTPSSMMRMSTTRGTKSPTGLGQRALPKVRESLGCGAPPCGHPCCRLLRDATREQKRNGLS